MPVKKKKKATKAKKIKLPKKVMDHLAKAGIKHDVLEHRTVYTAIDAANTMKKRMDEIAKSLLVKADKDYYMVILPADQNLDLDKLKKLVSKQNQKEVKIIKIPGEKMAREALKVKQDAIAAFGSMYKIPVVMDKKLEKLKKAVFSSDSFNHSVEMTIKDFKDLEKAIVGSFGVKKKIKKSPKVKTNKKKVAAKKPIKVKKK